MKQRSILEKVQLAAAILSFTLITLLSFFFLDAVIYDARSMAEVWFARLTLFLIEFLPAALLLAFSLLRRNPAYAKARWMPVTLLVSRLLLETLAGLTGSFYEYSGLTFISSYLDEYSHIMFIILAVMLFFALFCARGTFLCISGWILFVTVCISPIIIDEMWGDLIGILWYISYLLWFLSLEFLAVNLTKQNRYIKGIGNILQKCWDNLWALLEEIFSSDSDREENDDNGAPSEENNYSIDTYIRDYLYRKDTVLLRTPWNDIVILEADWDGSRYHIVDDEEHIRRVMDYIYEPAEEEIPAYAEDEVPEAAEAVSHDNGTDLQDNAE